MMSFSALIFNKFDSTLRTASEGYRPEWLKNRRVPVALPLRLQRYIVRLK